MSNMSSYMDASLDAAIRFSIEVFVLIFSISLIICLIVQIKRGKEHFDSGFFHIFILLAICDSIGNFMMAVVFHLPATSVEHYYDFYKEYEHWFCGFVYPIGAGCVRISFIGQNFIALNRFTAVFLVWKHGQIWSKRNTILVICFAVILGVFLQSFGFFGDDKQYLQNLSGCTYGNLIGTNLAVDEINRRTQAVTAGITAIICITLSIATIIKLYLLRKNGTISSQHKREIPLLVYSVTLSSLETILAVTYAINSQAKVTGGDIFNQMFGWVIFLYYLAPSVLLFLTSKTVRNCYLNFYMPKKWSSTWNSTRVVNVTTTH